MGTKAFGKLGWVALIPTLVDTGKKSLDKYASRPKPASMEPQKGIEIQLSEIVNRVQLLEADRAVLVKALGKVSPRLSAMFGSASPLSPYPVSLCSLKFIEDVLILMEGGKVTKTVIRKTSFSSCTASKRDWRR